MRNRKSLLTVSKAFLKSIQIILLGDRNNYLDLNDLTQSSRYTEKQLQDQINIKGAICRDLSVQSTEEQTVRQ